MNFDHRLKEQSHQLKSYIVRIDAEFFTAEFAYLTCIKIRAALGAPILVLRELQSARKAMWCNMRTHC